MLFILPLIVVAMAFVSRLYPQQPVESVTVRGVINFPFLGRINEEWRPFVGFILILGLAYMVFFISERFKLLAQTTTLPSFIYILLTSGIMVNLGFDALLISVFLVALAIGRLQMAINDLKSNRTLYDFGCLVMLAVAIYPKFILLLFWAFGVLFFSGRSTLKDIMALWLGWITPVLFIAFYYFWNDQLEQLPVIFTSNLLVGTFIHDLPTIELIRLGMLVFLLLVALFRLSTKYSILVVSQRRGILSLVSLLIFLSLTFLIIPGNYYDFMYIFGLPLSFLYAYYFINSRMVIMCNLMFIFLLGACFLTYLI